VIGLEKKRFKVSANPFNNGIIISDLVIYPVRKPLFLLPSGERAG